MYGEETGLPPQSLYTRKYVERALRKSKKILDLVLELITGTTDSTVNF